MLKYKANLIKNISLFVFLLESHCIVKISE